jgi:hypothetical protein
MRLAGLSDLNILARMQKFPGRCNFCIDSPFPLGCRELITRSGGMRCDALDQGNSYCGGTSWIATEKEGELSRSGRLSIKQDAKILVLRCRPNVREARLQDNIFCSQAMEGIVMVRKAWNLISFLLLLTLPVFAQGRGGSQGRQQSHGQNQGSVQAGVGQRDRNQVHLSTQQQDQLRTCDRLADGIRKQARAMSKAAGGNSSVGPLSGQRDQIRNKVREMDQEHNRLMSGIEPDQQRRWQAQIKNMTQLRQQLQTQLQRLDDDVDSAPPDPKRITARTREIERTMSQWQKQYSILSSGSGI